MLMKKLIKIFLSLVILFSIPLAIYFLHEKYNPGENMELNYKGKIITFAGNENVLTIVDSYEIEDKISMIEILDDISKEIDFPAGREINDMIYEWRAHNLLYNLHFMRKHTKSVDFERDQSKVLKFLYKCLSIFYW